MAGAATCEMWIQESAQKTSQHAWKDAKAGESGKPVLAYSSRLESTLSDHSRTRCESHMWLPRCVRPQSRIHLCHPTEFGPAVHRFLRAVPDEVTLQRSHADARSLLKRSFDVLDESVAKLDELVLREIRLVVVEAGEELGSLVWRRIVNDLLQVDASWSDESRVELLNVIGREEEDALGGRGCDAVEGVEQAGEGDIRAEAAGRRFSYVRPRSDV